MNLPQPPTLETVCGRAARLPTAPSLMPRLINVLNDVDSNAEDIERIIQIDPALASTTLRLANSAYFGAGQPVDSVREAVMKLGLKEIYQLASMALVNRWESGSGRNAYGSEPGDFCRHAVCTALAAEILAEKTGYAEPQMAYTAGLVCDIGKFAVAYSCHEYFPMIRAHQEEKGCSWMTAEKDILGYDHAEAGASLLRSWHFPEVLVNAAGFVNHPADAPVDARQLLALLHAAKLLATSFGPGVADDGFLFELNERFLIESGFTPALIEEALPIVLERSSQRLKDSLSHGPVAV